MEIYLIRHTTPSIEKGFIYGRTEVPLADSFEEEKNAVLKQLPFGFEAIYSSPSARCRMLAGFLEPAYKTEEDLCEMNFGDWETKTWDTINREDSEVWMNDFVHLAPPNGESMLSMQERVMRCWQKIIEIGHQSEQDKVAIVTHGGVIRIILAHYQHVALKDSFTIKVGFSAVFKLSVSS